MNYPQILSNYIADLIFPKKCILCGIFNNKKFTGYLCKSCLVSIALNNSAKCIVCKRQSARGVTCQSCLKKHSIDQFFYTADYADKNVIKIIKIFKYRFILDMAHPIFDLQLKFLKILSKKNINIFENNPLIIPVPLHKNRLNWRGFNQSEILAKKIANHFYLPFEPDLLIRIKKTYPQAEIKDSKEKLENMARCFKITNLEKVKNKTIMLIDDVCTTGTTLNECARVLKEAGAKKIIGFTIARG